MSANRPNKYTFNSYPSGSSKDAVRELSRRFIYDGASHEEEASLFKFLPTPLNDERSKWFREMFEYFRPETMLRKSGGQDYTFEVTAEPNFGGYHKAPKAGGVNRKGMAIRAIRMVLDDGRRVSLSYIYLQDKQNWEADLRSTLRHIVRGEIDRYRDFAFSEQDTLFCQLTGNPISGKGAGHVDHFIPFEVIAKKWISEEGIVAGPHLFSPKPEGGVTVYPLKDEELAMRWVAFHNLWFWPRILSPEANIKRGSPPDYETLFF